MSRISYFVVSVMALMSLPAVMSSGAGAVTWHNTGNTAWTATGGPMTLTAGGQSIFCSSSDTTSNSPALTTSGVLMVGTIKFTGCTAVGATHMHCSYTFTGTSATFTVVNGTADIHCGVVFTGLGSCTVAGTIPGVYTNPVHAGSVGRLHLLHPGSLTSTNVSGCFVTGAGTLTTQTLTVTNGTGGMGTVGPRFIRTA